VIAHVVDVAGIGLLAGFLVGWGVVGGYVRLRRRANR